MAKYRQRFNIDGKEHRVTGNTQQEVLEKAVEATILSLQRNGKLSASKPQRNSGKTFGDYASKWLALEKKNIVTVNTYENYRYILRAHVLPFFGSMAVERITREDVQLFFLQKKGYAKSTCQKMRIVLKAVLDNAVEDELITRNPARSKKVKTSTKVTERKPLDEDELHDIILHIQDLQEQERLLLSLLIYTGMRRGEVLGLRWEDIDTKEGVVHVTKSAVFTPNKNAACLKSPKTKSGERDVPIDERLLEILQPLKETGFIIGDGHTPMDKPAFNKMWKRIKGTIDLHGATPHVFRHTYLTLLAATEIDVKTLQEIAGHANVQTTLNVYVHPMSKKIVEAKGKVKQAFDSILTTNQTA